MSFYEEGTYTCEILGHTIGKSKVKGTPQVEFQILPEGGEFNRKVVIYFTEKTAERSIGYLRDLGWYGDSFGDLANHSFEGVNFDFKCIHRDGYDEFEFPRKGATVTLSASDGDAVRKLDNLFGDALAKTSKQPANAGPVVSSHDADTF